MFGNYSAWFVWVVKKRVPLLFWEDVVLVHLFETHPMLVTGVYVTWHLSPKKQGHSFFHNWYKTDSYFRNLTIHTTNPSQKLSHSHIPHTHSSFSHASILLVNLPFHMRIAFALWSGLYYTQIQRSNWHQQVNTKYQLYMISSLKW